MLYSTSGNDTNIGMNETGDVIRVMVMVGNSIP